MSPWWIAQRGCETVKGSVAGKQQNQCKAAPTSTLPPTPNTPTSMLAGQRGSKRWLGSHNIYGVAALRAALTSPHFTFCAATSSACRNRKAAEATNDFFTAVFKGGAPGGRDSLIGGVSNGAESAVEIKSPFVPLCYVEIALMIRPHRCVCYFNSKFCTTSLKA